MNQYCFEVLRVGATLPRLAIGSDGCIAEFVSHALNIYVLIHKPSTTMIEEANTANHGLRLAVYTYHDVITFAVKPGNLRWNDVPYSPHTTLLSELPGNEQLEEGLGIAVNYFLVDSSSGEILEMRTFALSNSFSNYLIKDLYTIRERDADMRQFHIDVASIQARYSPMDIGTRLKQQSFKLKPSKENNT